MIQDDNKDKANARKDLRKNECPGRFISSGRAYQNNFPENAKGNSSLSW